MTRAEWIQRVLLADVDHVISNHDPRETRASEMQESLARAEHLADLIEKSGKAPWSDPNEGVLLKRLEDEAHRRGYLLGHEDAAKETEETETTETARLPPDVVEAVATLQKAILTKNETFQSYSALVRPGSRTDSKPLFHAYGIAKEELDKAYADLVHVLTATGPGKLSQ